MVTPPHHPDQPEEAIPGYDAIPPLDAEDQVRPEEVLEGLGAGKLPKVILGCATFGYGIYADTSLLQSTTPLRLVRLALASGVTAFDTAPWYHPSEIILGNCLRALKPPRDSYQLLTKVGKYGKGREGHTFTPETVRKCVERSLKRLGTDYLDVVSGNHLLALTPEHAAEYGLTESQLIPLGPGDEEVLAGIAELRKLQSEGKVRRVGIAGYPLPVLLRIALLTLYTTGRPLDIVQTYAHQTLATQDLAGFLPAFEQRAKVKIITNASPLAMGLLTQSGGPEWHPARSSPLFNATREAVTLCEKEGVKIEDVATDFGFKEIKLDEGIVPVVVGCKNLDELHLNLKSYKRAQGSDGKVADKIIQLMEDRGVKNWSWASTAE